MTQLSWDCRGSPKRIEVFRKVENPVRNRKVYHCGKNRKVDVRHNFQLHKSSEILLTELSGENVFFSRNGFRTGFVIMATISIQIFSTVDDFSEDMNFNKNANSADLTINLDCNTLTAN